MNNMLSSTATTRFSIWRCCFLLLSSLIVSSSVSGFSTASIGKKDAYYNKINQNLMLRVRYDCDGSATAFAGQRSASATSTTLRLSFSSEFPDMISTYSYCLKYHYFPTQSLTNAILTVVGDGLAQTQEENQRQEEESSDVIPNNNYYDPKRGLVYFFKGLGSGIMWAWWFDMADIWSMELTQSVLGSFQQQPQEAFDFASMTDEVMSFQAQSIRTGINILLEQFLVCPILFSVWDIPVTSLMRGSPVERLPDHIRQKLLPLLMANAKVWTLVNIVTYNIPLEYRLLFTSAASIVSESINSGITSQQATVAAAKPALAPLVSDIVGLDASLPMAVVAPGGTNVTLLELR